MLRAICVLFAVWLALVGVVNAYLLWRMLRRLCRDDGPLLPDDECPPALVVLCLRGGDPFLHRTLARLAEQDYPRYRVRIMLDSDRDEAGTCVRDALGATPDERFEVLTLVERRSTCTFKMSGILEATRALPPDVRVVALLDGDSVLHRSWLRELATPLVRGRADVVTGNRWYVPQRTTLGNLVRFWWSAFALPLMYVLRFPFGGGMAVRPELIQDVRLRERIGHAFSEDTTIGQFVDEQGGRVLFQRSLLVNNGEDVTLQGFFNFDTRQLLAVKMQHSGWVWLGGQGLLNSVMVVYPLLRGVWSFEPWVIALFRVVLVCILAQGFLQDWAVRRVLRQRGEKLAWWTPWRIVVSLLGLMLLPFYHVTATFRAYLTRRIVWRGVQYRLGGDPPVQVEQDLWAQRPVA